MSFVLCVTRRVKSHYQIRITGCDRCGSASTVLLTLDPFKVTDFGLNDQARGELGSRRESSNLLIIVVQRHHTPQAILLGLEGRPCSFLFMCTLTRCM